MEGLEHRLTVIRLKVERLLEENRRLKEANASLTESLEASEKTVELQKNALSELTERNKMIKLAKNLSSAPGDNYDIKIKINELVKEIDRCIDLLNE